ncbi:hypothetical protein [Cytobacillus oceanisediminis]|uniref:hypothetical protein n=1 Tax=Cytobacillus oceanisediminis TaxID=665099 RepID=UPI001587F6B9|nr:hypothetical protein [Cytobacillus oceanisediminis]
MAFWVLRGMATRNRRVGWEMVAMVGARRRKGVERWRVAAMDTAIKTKNPGIRRNGR